MDMFSYFLNRYIYPVTCYSRGVTLVSDCSIIFSFCCNFSEHVGKQYGVGSGCFASDGSRKIGGVLCAVQAGGKFCCFGAQLVNIGRQASSFGAFACASLTASSRAIMRPCSIIRTAICVFAVCEDSALSRSAHFFCLPLLLHSSPAINAPATSSNMKTGFHQTFIAVRIVVFITGTFQLRETRACVVSFNSQNSGNEHADCRR